MNLRRPRLLTILLFAITASACSSPSEEPKGPATQPGQTPPAGAATAMPDPVASPLDPPASEGVTTPPATMAVPGPCDGAQTNGILGTWSGSDSIPGDSASGHVPLLSTYRFCGAQTAGTFRVTADAQDTPHQGCHQFADLEGDFAVTGTTLVVTVKSGSGGTKDCPVASDNASKTISMPASRSYDMVLSGTTLTLHEVGQAPDTAVTYQKQ